MEQGNLKSIIKSLVQQCNIEAISVKDLTAELSSLYTKVEALENSVKVWEDTSKQYYKEKGIAEQELKNFKSTYVDPVEKLKLDREAFDKEKFKFGVEKEYAKREVSIYKELVQSLTATRMRNESYYGGSNGSNWSHSESCDKPNFPGEPFNQK